MPAESLGVAIKLPTKTSRASSQKLWKLEAIRGLAAVYVVIGHLTRDSILLFRFGQEAVIVFFLLSGFVIEYSHSFSIDKTFKSYFVKRLTRIYPVFLAMLLLCSLLINPDYSSFGFWRTLGGNLLMLQDFGTAKPNVIVPTLFASALWSLHYEWWFYMFYHPISTYICKTKQVFVVGIAGIVAALIYLRLPYSLPRLILYFPIWWIGVELARSYIANGKVRLKDLTLPITSVFAIFFILITCVVSYHLLGARLQLGIHPVLEPRHFFAAIATVFFALLWQKLGWAGFRFLKFGTLIAPISYSLYISHQPLLVDAHYFSIIGNTGIEYIGYFVVLIVFCWFTELKLYPAIRRFLGQSKGAGDANKHL